MQNLRVLRPLVPCVRRIVSRHRVGKFSPRSSSPPFRLDRRLTDWTLNDLSSLTPRVIYGFRWNRKSGSARLHRDVCAGVSPWVVSRIEVFARTRYARSRSSWTIRDQPLSRILNSWIDKRSTTDRFAPIVHSCQRIVPYRSRNVLCKMFYSRYTRYLDIHRDIPRLKIGEKIEITICIVSLERLRATSRLTG